MTELRRIDLDDAHAVLVGALPAPLVLDDAGFEALWSIHPSDFHEIKMHDVPGGFQLKPGMPVTADIKVGQRNILTYLFARVLPIGLEGMREP